MLSPGNFEGVKAVAKIRRRRHVVRVVSNNYKSPKYHSFLPSNIVASCLLRVSHKDIHTEQ